MKIVALKTDLETILPLRELFLQENKIQIRYNARHERGWTDSYHLTVDGVPVGYGAVAGKNNFTDRDALFEFFVIPTYRHLSSALFAELIKTSNPKYIECQSNEFLLSAMLYEFSKTISSDVILFADSVVTQHSFPEITFRRLHEDDIIPKQKRASIGDYILVKDGEIIATGGFLLHYNLPYADIYMEVYAPHRRKGYGSFIVQELKKACYSAGRVPAARCNINNPASKSTLIKAGFAPCGYMLTGVIKKHN